MPEKLSSLERLRRQIDQVDNDLHDLLMKRARLVGKIAAVKAAARAADGGGPVMRPEREAQVLRRLFKRHKGALHSEVIGRIWRELFPAMVRLQAPLEVIVSGGSRPVDNWDLARSYYGSATPMSLVKGPGPALGALAKRKRGRGSVVAILPLPGNRGDGLWWRKLVTHAGAAPRIIGKLPFFPATSGPAVRAEAMVVGHLDWRPSGDDQTFVAVSAARRTSVREILRWSKASGLPARAVAAGAADPRNGRRLHLLQISDYVGATDDRLDGLKQRAGQAVTRVIVIGGFPTCMGRPRSSQN